MQSKSANVDGVHMRWVEQGEGFPVVLLHGIPTSPTLWRKVMPNVAGARLLAWEMVGYGQSTPEGRNRDISVARQADHLRAWMHAVGVDRAVLVGHDLGGGVAQIAAVREPSLCAGLVLTNSIGYDSWPIPSVKLMRASGPLLARAPDAALRAILGVLMFRGHDDEAVARQSLSIHFAPYVRHGGGRALLRQVRALDVRDTLAVQDDLPSLRALPARVVWGAADQFQKIEYGERFARDLQCPLVRIDGGKHFVPEDHPRELADAIEEVVQEARAREGAGAEPARESHP